MVYRPISYKGPLQPLLFTMHITFHYPFLVLKVDPKLKNIYQDKSDLTFIDDIVLS
jgi:hypothetical protein